MTCTVMCLWQVVLSVEYWLYEDDLYALNNNSYYVYMI